MSYENLQRLPDPNTSPQGPGFVSQTLLNNTPGMVHPLNSGESVSVKFAGDYWTIELAYPQLTITEGATIFPFLYSLQGGFTNFYVQLPTMANPASGYWGTGVDSEVFAQGLVTAGSNSNQIAISTWAVASGSGDLAAGDLIKISSLKKIFMIVATDLTNDVMTLTLNSEITDTTSLVGSGIQPNDIKFRVRQKGAGPAAALTADGLYQGFTLSLKENTLGDVI
jgi:hypothetical protein